jgi:uncharacterized protein
MLPLSTLLLIAVSILATSFLSGIFGMAGGLILLGILIALMDVAPAIVLHGVTQFAANGWRAVVWREHIRWGIVWRYGLAIVATFAALRTVAIIPNKAVIYICLGLMPVLNELLPRTHAPDMTKPFAPWLCGTLMGIVQVLTATAGNFVDLFFQNSQLDRKTIVATKSATQTINHLMRVAYFGSFAGAATSEVPPWGYVGAIACAMAGTSLAGQALHRMTDDEFRRWSRLFINTIAVVFFLRGVSLLIPG